MPITDLRARKAVSGRRSDKAPKPVLAGRVVMRAVLISGTTTRW